MTQEYTGTIKHIGETVKVSEKFRKREFVISSEGEQYQQHISFQANQDRVDMLDNVAIGDKVKVSFGLNGRAWQKDTESEVKYFNTLVAFSVVKVGGDNF